jgi:hypothetical protein
MLFFVKVVFWSRTLEGRGIGMSLQDHADSLTASCTGSNQAKLTVLPHHPAQKIDLHQVEKLPILGIMKMQLRTYRWRSV